MLLGVCMGVSGRCACVFFSVALVLTIKTKSPYSKDCHVHQNSDIHRCQLVIIWQVQNLENDSATNKMDIFCPGVKKLANSTNKPQHTT